MPGRAQAVDPKLCRCHNHQNERPCPAPLPATPPPPPPTHLVAQAGHAEAKEVGEEGRAAPLGLGVVEDHLHHVVVALCPQRDAAEGAVRQVAPPRLACIGTG